MQKKKKKHAQRTVQRVLCLEMHGDRLIFSVVSTRRLYTQFGDIREVLFVGDQTPS